MERPKKSCSCFGIFSKKAPKKVDQGSGTHQKVRSSLINFSTSVFQSEENQMNNSLSSTQKIQSNLPFSNTLTSSMCRTPNIYQFPSSHIRENSANPCSELKAKHEDLPPVRRNSISFKQGEELPYRRYDDIVREKRNLEEVREKMMSTETSVVLKSEKGLERKVDCEVLEGKLDKVKEDEEVKGRGRFGDLNILEKLPINNIKTEFNSLENFEKPETIPKLFPDQRSNSFIIHELDQIPSQFPPFSKSDLKPQESSIPGTQSLEPPSETQPPPPATSVLLQPVPTPKRSFPASLSPLEVHPAQPQSPLASLAPLAPLAQFPPTELPLQSCEIVEELSAIQPKPEEKFKIFPSSNLPQPFISQEEPIIHLKSQNFQVDSFLPKPEAPVFLKISSKSSQSDDIPDPGSDPIPDPQPSEKVPEIPASASPKQSLNIEHLGENFLESNIFIKEAAKKSFENLVSRFSLEKKQAKLLIPGKPGAQAAVQGNLEVPRKVDLKFKNSQEILRELIPKPADFQLALGQNLNPRADSDEFERDFMSKPEKSLSHSKSLSVNNTVVIHESQEHSKCLSYIRKDFESSYSGKKIKLILDSNDLLSPQNLIISPRNGMRRLPSLKISPIKSILSADDYSDILSFLKNSPHGSAMSVKGAPDINVAKKYKLPALKPITPHYFHKKRSAPQLKQKPRISIEHA